jgi:KTSC domain
MNLVPVDSSNLKWVGYDPATRILQIEFGKVDHDDPFNRVYRYFDVPPEVHQSLVEAVSLGKYLNQNVVDHFRFEYIGQRGDLESDAESEA